MRCVIIGFGYWGKIVKKYIEESDNLELVGICDRHYPEAVKMEQLVEEKQIDCAIVCTPVVSHYEVVTYLLEHHIHVFCEKPLCKEYIQAEELYKLAAEKNVVLYTDYIYSVSPSIHALKNYLKELQDEIGKPLYIDMAIKQFGRFYKEDDVFEVIGVHMLSVLAYLFDQGDQTIDIRQVDVLKCGNNNLTETGTVHFQVDGISGKIECSLLAHDKIRRIEILCEQGLLIFDMMGEYTIQAIQHVHVDGQCQERIIEQIAYDENNNLTHVFADFAEAVQRRDDSKKRIALAVAKCLELIENEI